MDGFFEALNVFLHDHLPSSWFEDAHQHFGSDLTDDMIVQSVQEASEFFNLNAPMNIHEDWTTGVMTGMTFTENDDILIFNRQQMHDMGITDKEGFDLVMTHEGAHRKLQGIDTGFNAHQEELCCDYMAGVRAGLNGMEEGKLEASLVGTTASSSHPDGEIRVNAIEEGVAFAHEYMEAHSIPPKFSECLEHFGQTDVYASTLPQEPGHINLRPEHAIVDVDNMHPQEQHEIKEYTQADVDWYEKQARISSGSEQIHWAKEAQWARDHMHGYVAEDASSPSNMLANEVHEFHHGGQYGNATGDYWDDSHPEQGEIKGLFIDNKAAQIQYAKEAKENAEWHEKRSNEAIARGDLSAAKDHADRAAIYRRQERDAIAASKKCTK